MRSSIDSCNDALEYINNKIQERAFTQSGVADSEQLQGTITTLHQDENFKESSGVDISKVPSGESRNSQQGQHGLLDMSDYFSRPVSIYSASLSLSTDVSTKLSVWDLWSKTASVRSKMRNFAYLRGNLHVRISVSGTPFHYGRLLCSYQPYGAYNQCLSYYVATISSYPTDFRPLLLTYLSQSTGSSILNVNTNEPIEMICPFISTKPMHRLFNDASGAVAATASLTDFEDAGDLYIYTLNQIKCASSSPTNIYLQVYAWMEDVELGTNTATQMVITTEGGTADEREIGPVEQVCSTAAKVSDALSFIPDIAPFAQASSMIFSWIGKVASWFGWSKPVMISEPTRVRPEPFQNGALTIGYDTSHRIVLDPKQELHVDPRLCGTTRDELVISEISSRVSYINSFTWSPSSTALGAPLWVSSVTPNLGSFFYDSTNNHYFMQPSAMSFAAAPFLYWRGDIVFRFEIVASAFHRGKIGIYFEPNVAQEALLTVSTFLNKQYMKVVDIQQTNVFEVEVKWATYRAWLMNNGANGMHYMSDPANVYATAGFANGFIAAFPFTDLQSPDGSSISINVYAYCPNLQVNGATSSQMPSQRILTESGSADVVSNNVNCIPSVEISRVTLNESTATTRDICLDHFGEQPLSFRSLLKRYTGTQMITSTSGTGNTVTMVAQILPTNNLPNNATGASQNYDMDLFTYLRYAYLGVRGSIRMRLRLKTANVLSNLNWIKVGLMAPTGAFSNTSTTSSNVANLASLNGTTTFVPATNGGIEVEFPYYSSNLFQLNFSDVYDDAQTYADNMAQVWYRNMYCCFDNPSDSMAAVQFGIERASGEDFNLMRFCGAPPYNN